MRAAAILVCCALVGCGHSSREDSDSGAARSAIIGAALLAPRLDGALKLDGQLTEPAWRTAARTGPFVDATGAAAIPYSEARVLWDRENLYLGLYAADEDIEAHVTEHDGPVWTDDAFLVRIASEGHENEPFEIDISATGVVADAHAGDTSWESGVRLAVDRDGTVNNAVDQDEEWVIEAVVPFDRLGIKPVAGTRLSIDVSRCDTPKHAKRRCGFFGRTPNATQVGGHVELTETR